VFDDVHRLALELVRSGHIDGLRVDHVDGLADPKAYLDLLRQKAGPDIFLVVEKILGRGETLPPDWPIEGTTGYEFIGAMAGLLVDQHGASEMDTLYAANARHADIAAETLAAKRQMASQNFETELSVLVELAGGLHQAIAGGPAAADAMKTALVEFIAAFPVYRTYGADEGMPSRDREMLMRVAETVRRSNRQVDGGLLNGVVRFLTGDVPASSADEARQFTKRFQQLTGPVTAKAVEDTVFYRCNSLIALNEVGCDPSAKDVSTRDVHRLFASPANFPPAGLLATATHDTKRGEDARARLYALSEAPSTWADAVGRWRKMNASLIEPMAGEPAPEPDTEWLLYQALAGVWPVGEQRPGAAELAALSQRFEAYVEKALREAKLRTDWADTDEAYEAAVRNYAARMLSPDNADFLDDFVATLQPFISAGTLNSLAQTLIKMTAPGVPDFYQGVEGGDFSLVDPDNRQPVDFGALARSLESGGSKPLAKADLSEAWVKQAMVAKGLAFRAQRQALFARGDYLALQAAGDRRDHVFAFLRRHEDQVAITVVPRLTYQLSPTGSDWSDPVLWGNTTIRLPDASARSDLTDVLTGARHNSDGELSVATVLADFPVALLAG
jgi:(1->4)-alpha-D-glucan 1-alpha-D-glucosylmutase